MPDSPHEIGSAILTDTHKWQESPILKDLSHEEFQKLEGFIQIVSLQFGEVLFEEEEKGDGIFIIEEGEIEIYKSGGFVLSTLVAGQSFGGISTYSQQPRSASARAISDCKLAWLNKSSIQKLSQGGLNSISTKILNNYIAIQRQLQEKSDDKLMQESKKLLLESQERVELANFFTTLVFFVSIYAFAIRSGASWIDTMAAKTYLTVGLLVVMLFTSFIGMRTSSRSLVDYGFHWGKWKRSLPKSLLWSLAFILFATLLKYLLITFSAAYQGQALISFSGYKNVPIQTAIATTILYCIFAPVQEFLARGLTQTSLMRFLKGKYVTARAIMITTLLFSTTHLHLNTFFALAVILPSIFWGIMFAKQKSLLGVSISHIIIGIYVTFIMGGLE